MGPAIVQLAMPGAMRMDAREGRIWVNGTPGTAATRLAAPERG